MLINTTVTASVEFFAFDLLTSVPDSAIGYVNVEGDLRARINQVVANRQIGDEVAVFTGNGTSPAPTQVTFLGNQATLQFTSQDDPEVLVFDVSGVGTSELLTIQLEGTLEFENQSGPPTEGLIVAQVRLRR